MKKLFKTLAICAVAGTMCAGMAALTACSSDKTGEAYALTHTAGSYVGYTSVTVDGNGNIKDVTLTEVCLPNHVKFGDEKTPYEKVTYGDVTLLWDDESGNYKVGTQTVIEYYASEANCKAYYEAVVGNKITAYETADGTANTTAMTYNTLSKEENGYWANASGSTLVPAEGQTYWMANRDATVNYVKENGIDNLLKLTRATSGDNHSVWMDGEVSTGATWTDLTSADGKTSSNSVTYGQLIINAYNSAK